MTENDLQILKSKIDNGTVKISFTDGEEIIAKILSVSEGEKDAIFDVVSTNRQEKRSKKDGAYLANFKEISSVTIV